MISRAIRRRRSPRGSAPLEGPQLQVAPMLDMAFQLLAFFIFTFEPPSLETRLDLYLPAAPLALPEGEQNQANPESSTKLANEIEIDDQLIVTVFADQNGGLSRIMIRSPSVGEVEVADIRDLKDRLTTYKRKVTQEEPLRVAFYADNRLLYDQAARVLDACSAAGVSSIQLGSRAEPETDAAADASKAP